MNATRLIFSLQHEDPDIILTGLQLFIEKVLSENGESSFGYNGHTDTTFIETRNNDSDSVKGLLADYIKSSPRLEELFVVWKTYVLASDSAFTTVLMQAFAVILHTYTKSSGGSILCNSTVARILKEKIKSIKDQLGSGNIRLVHATLGLLLTMCRTSSHNCRSVYNCCIISCIPLLWTLIQKGRVVSWESTVGIKLRTDSRTLLVLLVIVCLYHADVNMIDHLLRPSSLLRKICNTVEHDEPEIVALFLNGIKDAILENRESFISSKELLVDSIFLRRLLELYTHVNSVVQQSVHGLMIDYCLLLCHEITINTHSKSHGGILQLIFKLKAQSNLFHRDLQSIILQGRPSFLCQCSALVSTNWEPRNTHKFICDMTHLCRLVNIADVSQNVKSRYCSSSSSVETALFAKEIARSLIPMSLLKKDMVQLLLSSNGLLMRMGLIYAVSVLQRINNMLHSKKSPTSLISHIISIIHQVLPNLPTLMHVRSLCIKIMVSPMSHKKISSHSNVCKQSENGRPLHFLRLVYKVLELYLSVSNSSAMENFDALKLLDDLVPWPASYTSTQALENVFLCVDLELLLTTLRLLKIATLHEKCFWLETFAHSKKMLNNLTASADWNGVFWRGPLVKLLLIISARNGCHDHGNICDSFCGATRLASDIFILILQQTKLYTANTFDFDTIQELETLCASITARKDYIFVVGTLLNLSYHWMAPLALKAAEFVHDASSSIVLGNSGYVFAPSQFNEDICDENQKKFLPFSPLLFCGLSICCNYLEVFNTQVSGTPRETKVEFATLEEVTRGNVKYKDPQSRIIHESMRSNFSSYVTSILLYQTQRVRHRHEYAALVSLVVTQMQSQNAHLKYSDIGRRIVSNVAVGSLTPRVLGSNNLLTAVCIALNQRNLAHEKIYSYIKFYVQQVFQNFMALETKSIVLCQCFELIHYICLSDVHIGNILVFLVTIMVDMIRLRKQSVFKVEAVYSRTIFHFIALPHSTGKTCRLILCAAAAMNLRRLLMNPKLICYLLNTNTVRYFARALSFQQKYTKDAGLFSLGLIAQLLLNWINFMESSTSYLPMLHERHTPRDGSVPEISHILLQSCAPIQRACSSKVTSWNSSVPRSFVVKRLSQLIIPSTLNLDCPQGDVIVALSISWNATSSSQLLLKQGDFEYLKSYLGLSNKSAIMATSLLSHFLAHSCFCSNVFAAMIQGPSNSLHSTYSLLVLNYSLNIAFDGGWIQSWLPVFEITLCETLNSLSIILKNPHKDKCDIKIQRLLTISYELLTMRCPKQTGFSFEFTDKSARSIREVVTNCIKYGISDFAILDTIVSITWKLCSTSSEQGFFLFHIQKASAEDSCFEPSFLLQMIIGHSKFLSVFHGDKKVPIPNPELLKIILRLLVLLTHELPIQFYDKDKIPDSLTLKLNILVDSMLVCYAGTLSFCDRMMLRIMHLISRVGKCKNVVTYLAVSLVASSTVVSSSTADPGQWISSVMSPHLVFPNVQQMSLFRHRNIVPQNIFVEGHLGVNIFNSHIEYLQKLNSKALLVGDCSSPATRDYIDDNDLGEIHNCRMHLEIERATANFIDNWSSERPFVDKSSKSSDSYDPCYWLPVIHYVLFSWDVPISQLIASGMVSFIIICLSSCSPLIRIYAVSSLQHIFALLDIQGPNYDDSFRSRPLVLLVFNFLRNSFQRNELSFYVSPTMAIFLGRAIIYLQQPLNVFFGNIAKYILSRPFCDLKDIALFDMCIARGDVVSALNKKVATLRLLRDSFSSQQDHINLCRKNTYQMLTLIFNVFGNQIAMSHAILNIVDRALCVRQSGRYLLERGVIFSWLKQQASPLSTFKLMLTRKVANQMGTLPTYRLAAPDRLAAISRSLFRRALCSIIILGGHRADFYLKEMHLSIQHHVDDCLAICSSSNAASFNHESFQFTVFLMWEISMAQFALNPFAESRRNWTVIRLLDIIITSYKLFRQSYQDMSCTLIQIMSFDDSQDRYRHHYQADTSEYATTNEYAFLIMMLAEISQKALSERPDKTKALDDYQNKMLQYLLFSLKSNLAKLDHVAEEFFFIKMWNLFAAVSLESTLPGITPGRNILAITSLKGMLHATRGYLLNLGNRKCDDQLMSQIIRWALFLRQNGLQEIRELFESSNFSDISDCSQNQSDFCMLSIMDREFSISRTPFFFEFQTNARVIALTCECFLSQLSCKLTPNLDTSDDTDNKCLDTLKEKLIIALRRVLWFMYRRILKTRSHFSSPLHSEIKFGYAEQSSYFEALDGAIALLWDNSHSESVQIFRAALELISIMVTVMDIKKGFNGTYWNSLARSLAHDSNKMDILCLSLATLEIVLQITLSCPIEYKRMEEHPIIFGKQKIIRRRSMLCSSNHSDGNFVINVWL